MPNTPEWSASAAAASARMPTELWGLVAQALSLHAAVMLASTCRTLFSAVRGPHGHQTSADRVVPFTSLTLRCAVHVTHVSVASSHELQALVRSGRRVIGLTIDCDVPVDHLVLQAGLQKLHFGYHFNRSVDKLVLPVGLQQLRFGYNFNQSVDQLVLPAGLQELHLSATSTNPCMRLYCPLACGVCNSERILTSPYTSWYCLLVCSSCTLVIASTSPWTSWCCPLVYNN
jgi:hypothetical protein